MDKDTSSHAIVRDNIPAKSVEEMNKFNERFNSSIEIIEITDETHSDGSVIEILSEDEIIDITDTVYFDNINKRKKIRKPSKAKSHSITTYDISNTTIIDWNKHENSKTVSLNKIIPFYNDVQILNHSACVSNDPIDCITISDNSDDENTLHDQSNKSTTDSKLIKEHNNIVNPLKRTYSSPLHNHAKKAKVNDAHKHETLSNTIDDFVKKKQQLSELSDHSQCLNTFEPEISTYLQSHNSQSSTTSKANRQLRPIIIDGLNIGHAHGVGVFSVKGIELCIKYFVDRGHEAITVFIPHHRQGPPGSKTNTILNELHHNGFVCFTPSRKVRNLRMTCYDDRIMLDYASRCGGVVVSNDNYRDLYNESDAFKEIIEQRQVMITFVKDEIIVPDDQYNLRHHVRSLSDILCYP